MLGQLVRIGILVVAARAVDDRHGPNSLPSPAARRSGGSRGGVSPAVVSIRCRAGGARGYLVAEAETLLQNGWDAGTARLRIACLVAVPCATAWRRLFPA